jgi:hypothetical protein
LPIALERHRARVARARAFRIAAYSIHAETGETVVVCRTSLSTVDFANVGTIASAIFAFVFRIRVDHDRPARAVDPAIAFECRCTRFAIGGAFGIATNPVHAKTGETVLACRTRLSAVDLANARTIARTLGAFRVRIPIHQNRPALTIL